MIPLYDDNPTFLRPYVTVSLIAACVLVYFWQTTIGWGSPDLTAFRLGFTPAAFFEPAAASPDQLILPPWLTVFTAMFLHGDLFHLGGNMLFLWVFGNNVEDAMGHVRFLAFYLICGLAAAASQGLADPDSTIPMIGASGAVSGTLGAYLLLHPRAKVIAVIPLAFIFIPVRLGAIWILSFWIVLQLTFAFLTDPAAPGVAWWAHVAGFFAGIFLILFMRRPGVNLWSGVDAVPAGPLSRSAMRRGLIKPKNGK